MAHVEEPPRGAPLWCVSYGDLMSLLLGFFILLYALAGTKKEKNFDQFAEAMKRQFGFTGDPSTWFPGPHRTFGPSVHENGAGSKEASGDEAGQKQPGAQPPTSRLLIPASADTRLGVVLLFVEDESALPAAQQPELIKFADQVRGKRQKIEIRGHASGRPPREGADYRDAWDLAFQRSYGTMQFLVQVAGIEPERIRLSAAGQNERSLPIADVAPEAASSRVEVFLLDEMVDDRRAGEPAAPANWTEEPSETAPSGASP